MAGKWKKIVLTVKQKLELIAKFEWLLGDLSLGVKQSGHEADHPLLSSAEVKIVWNYASTTPYIFMVWLSTGITLFFLHGSVGVYNHEENSDCYEE
jgi:hypothetical protein